MSAKTVNPVLSRTANALADAVDELVRNTKEGLAACGMDVKDTKFPDFRLLDPERFGEGMEEVVENSDTYLVPVRQERQIGAAKFNTKHFANSVGDVAEAFGFDKSILFKNKDENAIYRKTLDTLDVILSTAQLFPLDDFDEAKEFIEIICNGLRSYLPKMERIGEILAMAPGLNKYSRVLVSVGNALDEAVNILDEADDDSINKAIDQLRRSLKELRKLNIKEVNAAAKDIVVDMTPSDVITSAPKGGKKKTKKTSERFEGIILPEEFDDEGHYIGDDKSTDDGSDDEEAVTGETTGVVVEIVDDDDKKPSHKKSKKGKGIVPEQVVAVIEAGEAAAAEPKKEKKKAEEKPKDNTWAVSEETIKDAVAMNQQIAAQFQQVPQQPQPGYMQMPGITQHPLARTPMPMPQPPINPDGMWTPDIWEYMDPSQQEMMRSDYIKDPSQIASFLNGNLDPTEGPQKQVPAIFEQNTMQVQRVPIEQQVFSPAKQDIINEMVKTMMDYPFTNTILEICNRNGYFVDFGTWGTGTGAIVYVRVQNKNGFLADKSFAVDMGGVIDKRLAIWPVAKPDGTFNCLESATEAYYLNGRDGAINTEFLDKIIKYGFSNLDAQTKKNACVYSDRMTATNRRIAMIGLDSVKGINPDGRSRIRGACIRVSPKMDPAWRRFEFKEVDGTNLRFILSNENTSDYYGGPVIPKQDIVDLVFYPSLDENGKYIRVNEKGTDIQFKMDIKHRIPGTKVSTLPPYKGPKMNNDKDKKQPKKK